MLRLQYVRNMDMVDDAVVESGGTYVKDSEYLVAVVVLLVERVGVERSCLVSSSTFGLRCFFL